LCSLFFLFGGICVRSMLLTTLVVF
jgi:hypothetical protein